MFVVFTVIRVSPHPARTTKKTRIGSGPLQRPVQTQALAHASDKGRVRARALICEYRCAFMCT